MRMKKFAAAMLVAALSCGSAMSSMAATWVSVGADWKYQKDDGSFMADSWLKHTDGKWYFLGADTMMKKGWYQDKDQKWYFLSASGVMQTGLIEVDGKVYWMEDNGALFIGDKLLPNGLTYNFGINGCTNGSPYTSNKFYGNGNAVVAKNVSSGGGSSSGSGSNKPSLPVDAVKDIEAVNNQVEAVKEEFAEAVGTLEVGNAVATSTTSAKVAVSVGLKENADISMAQGAVEAAVSEIVEAADEDTEVEIVLGDGIKRDPYTKAEALDKISDFVDRFVSLENLENSEIAKKGSITVKVNGIMVTYNVSYK